jgi:putative SOS response-associated peptidase YedK
LVDPETETETRRRIALLRWGFIPASASDAAIGRRVPTIKAEALARKPALWDAIAHRRCLVPADGFSEWQGEGSERRRWWISLVEDGPFAFAGLWTRRYDQTSNRVIRSFAIITTTANELCAPLTGRMPVFLDPVHYTTWLGEVPAGRSRLLGPLQPLPAERMRRCLLDDRVENIRPDDPQRIAPAARV